MTALLAALHLDNADSLKRALVTGIGAGISVLVMLLSPVLSAHGVPMPSQEMQLGIAGALAAMIVPYVLQSGAKSAVIAHAEIIAQTPGLAPDAAAAQLLAAAGVKP